ncbi:MAG: hypothetical protein EZS28_031056 [Streblomastix strix]|uniref:Uncharacterized protein n=1 Tax=Streblomastix strix TaxID=222440 RepID=A0A5J4USN1_9EUKA|nr:MAG: hypothetical protein EZS28_031056 [Streblomastix strix]
MAEQVSITFDRDMEEMKAKNNELKEQIQQKDNENKQLEARAVPDGYQTDYIFAVQVEDDDENENAVLNIRRRNRYCTISRTYSYHIVSLSDEIQAIVDQEDINARKEFESRKGSDVQRERLMDIDGDDDDYDYYETRAARQDRIKARAKTFGRLPFHPSMIQRTRKHACPQFREEAGDVLATLVGYLNRDIKKINRLSSAVSARKYIEDKHLGNRFSVQEQDLDDNVATPDNVVVYDKKKNAIYSVDGFTTAVGFGDPEHQHKRYWKKKYYSDVNDLERAALAAKLKQQGIKGGLYMKWLSMTKSHKVREIKDYSFRAFTLNAKNIIDANGGAKLPMATKQQIMASAWNSVLVNPAVERLELQDGKIDIYNRSNKTNIQSGQYEYLPLAKRLYKKELPAVITQLYQADDIDARIKEVLAQATAYYGNILTQRQQQIGGFNLAKYKFQ